VEANMIEAIQRVFQIQELRKKILFTLFMIAIYRVGGFVPVPGINGEIALNYFRHTTGGGQNLFQLVDIFSGGAFSHMTIFALGVVPYISSSIILQLLVALVPSLQREIKENPEYGKKKINRWTRFGTLILSFIQSSLFAKYAMQINVSFPGVIAPELMQMTLFGVPWLFYLILITTMTTGTVLLMWIGEQITEKGIGNGMSLIICVGILAQLPTTIGLIIQQLNLDSPEAGQLSFFTLVVLFALFVAVAAGTIFIIQGQRRIPLQYARRVVGIREVQAVGTSYIPLKVNYAGVIPVIFASAILMFPATLGQFVGAGNWMGTVANWLSPGSTPYLVGYILLIIFFTYFWTATQFRPDQIASDMKRNGAFIPGVRQGKHTQEYLEQAMNSITLIGAGLLAIIAVLPQIIGHMMNVSSTISYFFGGTALLILVGVVLDTMKQIESHLVMKRYEGFMKKGRAR
jgi:preprotein translocase subunit SecY